MVSSGIIKGSLKYFSAPKFNIYCRYKNVSKKQDLWLWRTVGMSILHWQPSHFLYDDTIFTDLFRCINIQVTICVLICSMFAWNSIGIFIEVSPQHWNCQESKKNGYVQFKSDQSLVATIKSYINTSLMPSCIGVSGASAWLILFLSLARGQRGHTCLDLLFLLLLLLAGLDLVDDEVEIGLEHLQTVLTLILRVGEGPLHAGLLLL